MQNVRLIVDYAVKTNGDMTVDVRPWPKWQTRRREQVIKALELLVAGLKVADSCEECETKGAQ